MTRVVNIHDRESVRAAYSFEDYSQDVGGNSLAEALVYRGVLIESPPDTDGNFRLRIHARSISEGEPGPGGVFVCPFLRGDYASFYVVGGNKGAVLEQGDIFKGDDEENYRLFLERLIKTASETEWPEPMDPNRLKNFG